MVLRLALCIGVIAAALSMALAAPGVALAETAPAATPAPTASPATPAPAAAPEAKPPAAAPDQKPAGSDEVTTQPGDAFGEDTTLTAKPIVYIKGTGTWDSAFETITGSFKKLHDFVDKEGLKTDGLPMTVFTATDDNGFQYQAEVPIAEAPKNPPHGDIAVGQSPEGHALKFVHRGSYDALDNTYEAITNYLDEKRLEAKDMFIEQYVTDPATADEDKLVVNVYVMIK